MAELSQDCPKTLPQAHPEEIIFDFQCQAENVSNKVYTAPLLSPE